jgi:hypothetical protein
MGYLRTPCFPHKEIQAHSSFVIPFTSDAIDFSFSASNRGELWMPLVTSLSNSVRSSFIISRSASSTISLSRHRLEASRAEGPEVHIDGVHDDGGV